MISSVFKFINVEWKALIQLMAHCKGEGEPAMNNKERVSVNQTYIVYPESVTWRANICSAMT